MGRPEIVDFRGPKNHAKRWGASPPHIFDWFPGLPGPPRPRFSTISGRPKNHVLQTQVYVCMCVHAFVRVHACTERAVRAVPFRAVPSCGRAQVKACLSWRAAPQSPQLPPRAPAVGRHFSHGLVGSTHLVTRTSVCHRQFGLFNFTSLEP